jgi:hypothetical protein
MSNYVERAEWWRIPAPQVHQGKYFSVIQDRGELTKALPSSKNQYLFSETTAGVKPLAIIGTALQIMELLQRSASRSIVSEIRTLPDIYMGISLYAPRSRFEGLFPANEVMMELYKYASSFIPIPPGVKVGKFFSKLIADLLKADAAKKQQGRNLFVKFSYLPENGMVKVGQGSLSCQALLAYFESQIAQQ